MTNKPIRVDGDVAYVPLTKGYEAVIDAADVDLVSAYSWRALVRKDTVYAQAQTARPNRVALLLHRVVIGAPSGLHVDHKDGDGLNNRQSNLRLATRGENSRNCRLSRANTSGLKGASYDKRSRRWQSYIRVKGKMKHLGLYDSAEAAHRAYCRASETLHGDFGRTK